jgi:predicted PurR-regulated permease PerM
MRALTSLLIVALIIAGLVVGRNFLVPLTIAFLMTTLIAATGDRLQRFGLPSTLALLGSLIVFTMGLGAVFYVLAGQVDAISEAWPRYVERFEALADRASEYLGSDISEKLGEVLANLNLVRTVPSLLGSAGSLMGNFILIALYVGFMLAERGQVTSKLGHLFANEKHAVEVQQTVDDIVNGLRDYIWIKTLMSVFTAAVSYAVLKWLGVDFSETWALLIFLLNYIPSIGSVLGVVFPALIALIQFDTVSQFLVIAVLLSGAQFLIGNVLEPAIMGRTLNLSPFVVMVSLAFWGMIWGLVGAFLSVPLTAAIAIACSKVKSWRWVAVLLSENGRIDEWRN